MLPTLDAILADLDVLDDWEDRYGYLIDLGRKLDPLPEEARVPANLVRGCASQVWLDAGSEPGPDGGPRLRLRGDSDAAIVRGLVAFALALYGGRAPAEALGIDAGETFASVGLIEHLSAQRANGVRALVERIKGEAARLAA